MPATGGTYAYLRRAFGEPAAFAFGWMMLLIGGPTAIAALAAVAASAILLVSVIATLHVTVLAFARVTLAMGGDGILFPALAGVTSRGVPARAVLTTCAIAAFAVLIAGFDKLSDAFIFNTWIFDLLVAVALIVLRRREPNAERPYRVAAYPLVPAIFILSALYVLIETIIAQPLASAIGLAIIATAFPIYALRRTRRGAAQRGESRR
jgi:APA family basic amino acid/polyamine antiporter